MFRDPLNLMESNSSCDDWDTLLKWRYLHLDYQIFDTLIMSVLQQKDFKWKYFQNFSWRKNIYLENQFPEGGFDVLIYSGTFFWSVPGWHGDREKYGKYFLFSALSLNLFGLQLIRSLISSSDEDLTSHIICSNIVICITGTTLPSLSSHHSQNLLWQ